MTRQGTARHGLARPGPYQAWPGTARYDMTLHRTILVLAKSRGPIFV
jgi:hypothetical protein